MTVMGVRQLCIIYCDHYCCVFIPYVNLLPPVKVVSEIIVCLLYLRKVKSLSRVPARKRQSLAAQPAPCPLRDCPAAAGPRALNHSSIREGCCLLHAPAAAAPGPVTFWQPTFLIMHCAAEGVGLKAMEVSYPGPWRMALKSGQL